MELAFPQQFRGLLAVNVIGAAVPNHHRAAAVVSFRNDAFEGFVFDRMILNFDRQMFFPLLPRKTFRDRPGFQDAFHLQAEIVMQPARIVFLDEETRCSSYSFRWRFATFWFSRFREIALSFVFGESHCFQFSDGQRPPLQETGDALSKAMTKGPANAGEARGYNQLSPGRGSPTRVRGKAPVPKLSPPPALFLLTQTAILS